MFKKQIKKWKSIVKQKIRDVCEVEKIDESFDALFYFLNNSIDIREFPKATGNIRKLQLADAELLRIFNDVCKKNELDYWLDWGTLLGCIRHKGFIPWDDDLDVCMPRSDYNRAKSIIPEEFSKIGYNTVIKECIYIYHQQTGTVIDIFAMDSVEDENDIDALTAVVEKKLNDSKIKCIKDALSDNSTSNRPIYLNAPEQVGRLYIHHPETIFPLSIAAFEGIDLCVPHDADKYLKVEYGDYMSFPREGILKHGNNGPKLYDRAEINNIDMDDFIDKLKAINVKDLE